MRAESTAAGEWTLRLEEPRLWHARHRHVRLPELRGGELSLDFGAILVARGGRVWRIGLVEDTRLTDGASDLIVKLHTSW